MSHEITTREDGTAEAAFAIKSAWHGLGTVVDHAMSSAEAIELAQLDWEVVQRSVAYSEPKIIQTSEGEVEGQGWNEVPDLRANIREDTGLFLGTVSDRYKIVQNREAFQFMDRLVESGQLQYETEFSLNGGKRVVITARLPEVDVIADGDQLERFILMSMAHDGTAAIKFGVTSVRTVCANTLALALASDGKTIRDLSVSHTGKIEDRLQKAKAILGLANSGFDQFAAIGRELATRILSRDEWEAYLNVLCPVPAKIDPDWTERRERNIVETRDQIAACFRNDRNSLDGIQGTAWAAFNAVTEHVDHLPRRGASQQRKAEARFNVTQYGPGNQAKQRAFEAACRIADVECQGAIAV